MSEPAVMDAGGASLVVPGPPQKRQKSRTRSYRRAYHRAYYGTVSACLPRPVKEAFRDACQRLGRTQHSVIAEWVVCWLETGGNYPAAEVAALDGTAPAATTRPGSAVAVIGQ